MKYDQLYQEWLTARQHSDFPAADALRDDFERLHGLTIFAEGAMPVENVTVRRMKASTWQRKYGSVQLAEAIERQDSKVSRSFPTYKGIMDEGYHSA